MTNTKHTPAPWTVSNEMIFDSDKNAVADCMYYLKSNRPLVERQANAHLIAAAPDMYKALNTIIEFMPTEIWAQLPQYMQDEILDSHTKAKGE